MKTRATLLALSFAVLAVPGMHAGSCCHTPETSAPAATLPGTSIYHQAGVWSDQTGQEHALTDFAGSPVIMTMIFTRCGYACPRTIEDIQALQAALPPGVREKVKIVLASFDVDRDTPTRLREWAEQKDLGAEWTLLHGNEASVRELAVLLDIAFQKQTDGSFAHANRIVLLDQAGVAKAAVDGLGGSAIPVVEAAVRLVSESTTLAATP